MRLLFCHIVILCIIIIVEDVAIAGRLRGVIIIKLRDVRCNKMNESGKRKTGTYTVLINAEYSKLKDSQTFMKKQKIMKINNRYTNDYSNKTR